MAEGTGGFFIGEGAESKRLLLVTAHHVALMPDKDNKKFEHKKDSQRRHDVILLGDAVFKKLLESIQTEIR